MAPFALLQAAVVASGAGNGVAAVAIPWLVLDRTGDPAAAGLVGAASALPLLLSAIFSGTVVDSLGRRRTSVISDVLSALSVAAIPVIDRVLGLDLGLIVVLAAIGALFDPAGATARESMIPEAARASGLGLERANGVHEASWGVAYMIGPALGGGLIALVGAAATLWATAGAFVLSIAAIALLRAPGMGRPPVEERPEGLLRGSLQGVSFVWRTRVLRTLALVMMLIVAIYMPIEGVLLPVIFEAQEAPGRLGVVLMAMSGGGVAGSLLYSVVAKRLSRRAFFIGALTLASASILGMSTLPAYPLLIALAAMAGFFWGPMGPLLNLEMQIHTPPQMRGRVLGVLMAVFYSAGPAGYLAVGWLTRAHGAEVVFTSLGVLIVVAGLGCSLLPSLRDLDEPGPYEAELTARDLHPPVTL